MRLHCSVMGRRFLIALPIGLVFAAALAGAPGSAARLEGARGDRGLTIGPDGIHVRIGGSRRWFRFPGDPERRAAVVARLRKASRDGRLDELWPPAGAIRSLTGAAAVEGFLAPMGRLSELESYRILTDLPSIDLDGDGRGEVLLGPVSGINVRPAEVWQYDEGTATFVLAHRYTTTDAFRGSLEAVGDADGDGAREIVTAGFDHTPWRAVVYLLKQLAPGGYDVTEMARFVGHDTRCACLPVNADISDLDGDHRAEVVYGETDPGHLSINERGDGGDYREVFLRRFDELLLQRTIVTGDLDDDGRREVLLGGHSDSARPSLFSGLFLYEADADDHYRLIWNNGPRDLNMVGLADAGDSDGDGLREFLAASITSDVLNLRERCTLYEYDDAGGFRATWEVSDSLHTLFDNLSVASYDFNGDGRREILCHHRRGADYVVDIYQATGNDTYELLSSVVLGPETGYGPGREIGFGDFDRDQRPEVVVNATEGARIVTNVYETTEAFPTPPPAANFGAQPLTGAAPLLVRLTDLSEGIVQSRLWDFGDGQTSVEAAPTHVYERPGVYTVRLSVDGPGGSDTKTRSGYVRVGTCPAVALLSREGIARPEAKLRSIRQFRDRVLARSGNGRRLIASYYRNVAEVDRLLRARPALAWSTARLLVGSLPRLADAAAGTGVLTFDAGTWTGLLELMADYQAAGSPELRRDLAEARALLSARTTPTANGAVRLDLRDQSRSRRLAVVVAADSPHHAVDSVPAFRTMAARRRTGSATNTRNTLARNLPFASPGSKPAGSK